AGAQDGHSRIAATRFAVGFAGSTDAPTAVWSFPRMMARTNRPGPRWCGYAERPAELRLPITDARRTRSRARRNFLRQRVRRGHRVNGRVDVAFRRAPARH